MTAHLAGAPSRKAQELAAHLQSAISDYRMRDAKVTNQDVEMAIKLLQANPGNELRIALAVIASIVGAFVAVGLGVAASKGRVGGSAASPVLWVMIGLAVTAAVVGVIVARRPD